MPPHRDSPTPQKNPRFIPLPLVFISLTLTRPLSLSHCHSLSLSLSLSLSPSLHPLQNPNSSSPFFLISLFPALLTNPPEHAAGEPPASPRAPPPFILPRQRLHPPPSSSQPLTVPLTSSLFAALSPPTVQFHRPITSSAPISTRRCFDPTPSSPRRRSTSEPPPPAAPSPPAPSAVLTAVPARPSASTPSSSITSSSRRPLSSTTLCQAPPHADDNTLDLHPPQLLPSPPVLNPQLRPPTPQLRPSPSAPLHLLQPLRCLSTSPANSQHHLRLPSSSAPLSSDQLTPSRTPPQLPSFVARRARLHELRLHPLRSPARPTTSPLSVNSPYSPSSPPRLAALTSPRRAPPLRRLHLRLSSEPLPRR